MIESRYFRIHTGENAYLTQRPRGLFTAVGRLVDGKRLSPEEVDLYWSNRRWFEAHLPIPPFYGDGNSIRAITWYKNSEKGREMFRKMGFYLETAAKYGLPLYLTQTDDPPGGIVYEDDYQIGVVDSGHSGEGFRTLPYQKEF